VAGWEHRTVVQATLDKLTTEERQRATELAALRAQYEPVIAERGQLDTLLRSAEAANTTATSQLAAWAVYEKLSGERARLEEQVVATQAALDALAVPVMPPGYVGPDTDLASAPWWAAYRAQQHELDFLTRVLRTLESGCPRCPTCGTPGDVLAGQRDIFVAEKTELSRILSAKEAIRQASEAYRQAVAADTAQRRRLGATIDQCREQLGRLHDLQVPVTDKAAMQQQVRDYQLLWDRATSLQARASDLERRIASQDGMLTRLSQTIQTTAEELAGYRVTADEAAAARGRIQAHNGLLRDHAAAAAEVALLGRLVDDDQNCLERAREIAVEATVTRQWLAHCEEMAQATNWDAWPRVVAEYQFQRMEASVNDMLARFEAPFTITTRPDLTFEARFLTGKVMGGARLSKGEKVVLSLAFRTAVHHMFARDLGVLCMDEPTEGLDQENLKCVRLALQRLRELSSSSGLQVLIITHERDLAPLFDHVIEF
jgi:DNA repair exonuclease SbcCD ATPase subunit